MATKKEKLEVVTDTVEEFTEIWDGFGGSLMDANAEETKELTDVLQRLSKSYKVYTTGEEHEGAEYYQAKLGDIQVKKARCKNCCIELNPRGVARHYKSPACEKERQRLTGEEPPPPEGDGEEEAK